MNRSFFYKSVEEAGRNIRILGTIHMTKRSADLNRANQASLDREIPRTPIQDPASSHTLIIGGGVIGICCAYYLATMGRRVTLLEQGSIAGGASFGNAGSIAPGHGPLNDPKLSTIKILAMLADINGPLYVSPRIDLDLASWFRSFRRFCTHEHLDHCMNTLLPLGTMTRRLFDELIEQAHLQCEYRHNGYYEVYHSPQLFSNAIEHLDHCRYPNYFRHEVISKESLLEREPNLDSHAIGAIHHQDATSCDPHQFVCHLANHCSKIGVSVHSQSPVEKLFQHRSNTWCIETENNSFEADEVVLASGIHSRALAKQIGVHLPLQAAKGYHRDYSYGDAPHLKIPCLFMEDFVFCTPLAKVLRLAGTLEFSGINQTIRKRRLDRLTEAAKKYLRPSTYRQPSSEWCGLRPCFPDGLPMVGRVPRRVGLYIATGHAMMGLTLGPATGKLLSELIVGKKTSMNIDALRVDRFGHDLSPGF